MARTTGQAYVLTNLLAGKARTLIALGRLPEALEIVEESVDCARLLNSDQQLVFALTQLCLTLAWSGDHEQALRAGEHVIYIPVRGKDQARKVAAAVRDADGRYVLYFGRWTIGQLPGAPPGS